MPSGATALPTTYAAMIGGQPGYSAAQAPVQQASAPSVQQVPHNVAPAPLRTATWPNSAVSQAAPAPTQTLTSSMASTRVVTQSTTLGSPQVQSGDASPSPTNQSQDLQHKYMNL